MERLYAERYPNRCHPCRKTIRKLTERAQQSSLKRIWQKSGLNAANSLVVLGATVLNFHQTNRETTRHIKIDTANRIIKIRLDNKIRFHFYQSI